MDYLALVLPSLLAYLVDHLAWVLGSGAILAALWSPPLRRLWAGRTRTAPLSTGADAESNLRTQLAAANDRIRLLEGALERSMLPGTPARRSERAALDAAPEGRIPTPV